MTCAIEDTAQREVSASSYKEQPLGRKVDMKSGIIPCNSGYSWQEPLALSPT